MIDRLSFLSSVVALFGLWLAFDAGFRPYRVNLLRDQLFRLRAELFELAREGQLGTAGFSDPAYLRIRKGLNSFIRYAHQFTLFRMIVLSWSCRWWIDQNALKDQQESLRRAVDKHQGKAKERLSGIMKDAEFAIILHMLSVNIIGFLLLRVASATYKILHIHRLISQLIMGIIESHRRLLVPIEEDAERRLDRIERPRIATQNG